MALSRLRALLDPSSRSRTDSDLLRMLAAEPAVMRIRERARVSTLKDVELRVFSQFGDDGIIQYLVHQLPIENDTFVEIGVEDYTEANTRFLLMRDNWRGLVVDSAEE